MTTKVTAVLGAVLAAAAAWAAIAPAQRGEPVAPMHWMLIVDGPQGETRLPLSEVVGLETQLVPGEKRSLPGKPRLPVAILRRGLDEARYLWEWHDAARANAPGAARDARLVLFAVDGQPVHTWKFTGCWPSSVSVGHRKGEGNDVAIEELSLVAESVQRVAP